MTKKRGALFTFLLHLEQYLQTLSNLLFCEENILKLMTVETRYLIQNVKNV